MINTGILNATEGGQIGAGVAQAPIEPFRDHLPQPVDAIARAARDRKAADELVGNPKTPKPLIFNNEYLDDEYIYI